MNIYVFMGTHLAEIRQCLRFLAGSHEADEPVSLRVPVGLGWPEPDAPDTPSASYDPAAVDWEFDPDAEGSVFILLDPRLSPVPQIERLAADLKACNLEPARVVTCVDCTAAEAHSALRAYYEACIYYSDAVLLGNRSGAANSFVRDYQKKFEHDCYPCVFLLLKGPGNPDRPLEILAPGTRRLSQIFDLVEEEAPEDALPGLVIEASCDLDLEEEENDPYRPDPELQALPTQVPDVSPWIVPPINP